MPKKKVKVEDDKISAFVTTFFSIFGFIIAILAWKKNKYIMFYAKQSLVIFILAVIVSIVNSVVTKVPILGLFIYYGSIVIVVAAWVASWVNSLSGKMKNIPIISDFTKKIEL